MPDQTNLMLIRWELNGEGIQNFVMPAFELFGQEERREVQDENALGDDWRGLLTKGEEQGALFMYVRESAEDLTRYNIKM